MDKGFRKWVQACPIGNFVPDRRTPLGGYPHLAGAGLCIFARGAKAANFDFIRKRGSCKIRVPTAYGIIICYIAMICCRTLVFCNCPATNFGG